MAPGTIVADDSLDGPGAAAVADDSITWSVRPAPPREIAEAFFHRSLHKPPVKVVAAAGLYLHTHDGRRILDASAGAAVACLGHGDARVQAAMVRQLGRVAYANSLIFTSDAAERLSRWLVGTTYGHMSRACIMGSGSEAMECAMKLARQFFVETDGAETRRAHFIARRESYHGTTLGGLSVSGHVARRAPFHPLLIQSVGRVSQCNAYRGMLEGEDEAAYVARLAQELEDEFQRLGPDTVCAFVAEPVVGAATGCVPAVEGYFQAVRAVCDRHGALLILDEVMSGMGRTGTLHAWEQEQVVPDIQTVAKGLGGGFAPVAAVLVNHKIVDGLTQGTGVFVHGHTYQGHPVSCAAALEVQRIIAEDGLLANVRRMGRLLERLLHEQVAGLPHVGNVRGRGLFWGIEFVRDKASKEPFEARDGVGAGVHELALAEPFCISLYPGGGCVDGRRGDHVLLAPPYTVGADEVRHIVQLTAGAIKRYFEMRRDAAAAGAFSKA